MWQKFCAVFYVILLTGCASQTGWTPTVDPYGDTNASNIDIDKSECRELALEASGESGREAAKGALAGGALGAAAGAVLGAATGDAGQGAKLGAAIGGVGGGLSRAGDSDAQYRRTFIRCMQNRGHNVIN
ncbi:MAG: glycine zipper family protein [Nitrospinales bacterium]